MHMVVAPLTNISCYEKFEKETFKIHQFAQPNNIEFINQVGIVIKRCMLYSGAEERFLLRGGPSK